MPLYHIFLCLSQAVWPFVIILTVYSFTARSFQCAPVSHYTQFSFSKKLVHYTGFFLPKIVILSAFYSANSSLYKDYSK